MRNLIRNFCFEVADIACEVRDLITARGAEIIDNPRAFLSGHLDDQCYDAAGLSGTLVGAFGASPSAGIAAVTTGVVSWVFGIIAATLLGVGLAAVLFVGYQTCLNTARQRRQLLARIRSDAERDGLQLS